MLEKLSENIDVHGNSASSILTEISHFVRDDLGHTIDLLKDVRSELNTKKDHGGNHSL